MINIFLIAFILDSSSCHNILRLSDTRVARFVLRHTGKVHAQAPYKEFNIPDEAACIDRCVTDGTAPCKSINFFQNTTDYERSVCQLTSSDITDSNQYTDKPGWRHFDTGKTRLTRLMHPDGYCFLPAASSKCDFTSTGLTTATMSQCNGIEAYFDFDRNAGIISHVCSGKALCPSSIDSGNSVVLKDFVDCPYYHDLNIKYHTKFRFHMNKFVEFGRGCVCQYPRSSTSTGKSLMMTSYADCSTHTCKMNFDFENGPVKVTIVDISGLAYNNLIYSINERINSGNIWGTRYIDNLMYRTRAHETFGTKMQTIFQAPTTGLYTFFIQVNKLAKVKMSTDATEANKSFRFGGEMIIDWDKSIANKYQTSLVKGKKYYLEVYTFDQYDDDYFYMFFTYPPNEEREVLGFEYLEPYTG